MAADTAYAKRVLLACNGGTDAVSWGVAVSLARHGYRLVLVGDEGALAATAEEARRSAAEGAAAIAVVGLDLAACDEAAVGAAVDAAWRCFGDGGLHALVNMCSYENMLGNEFYAGAFKDGSTWRTNKFTYFSPFMMPHPCDSHLWERHLFHCVPVPGQNSWTLESSPGPGLCQMASCLSPEQREKRKRDGDDDAIDVSENGNGESSSCSKKPKEDDVQIPPSSAEMPTSENLPRMNRAME